MDARIDKDGSQLLLRVERRLRHPPAKVWRVLTERELLKQWFPSDVEGEWRVGAELRFEFLHGEGEGLTEEQMRGEVLEVEVGRLLAFRWGDSVIRCEIEADGDGSIFRLSETLIDASWGARNAAGWEMCIENMELLFQGASIAKFAWDVWRPKFRRYKKKFEPVFGPQDEPPKSVRTE